MSNTVSLTASQLPRLFKNETSGNKCFVFFLILYKMSKFGRLLNSVTNARSFQIIHESKDPFDMQVRQIAFNKKSPLT